MYSREARGVFFSGTQHPLPASRGLRGAGLVGTESTASHQAPAAFPPARALQAAHPQLPLTLWPFRTSGSAPLPPPGTALPGGRPLHLTRGPPRPPTPLPGAPSGPRPPFPTGKKHQKQPFPDPMAPAPPPWCPGRALPRNLQELRVEERRPAGPQAASREPEDGLLGRACSKYERLVLADPTPPL